MGLPSMTMSPSSGFSNPAMQRRVVVLPQPLGPSSVSAQGGCFAAAAGSEQRQHFPPVHFQLDAVDCNHAFEAFKQAFYFNECH